MTFLDKLDCLRRAQGYSERALAKELGINQSAISRWRSRGSAPRPEITKKIADHFGLPVDVLLDDQKEVPAAAIYGHYASAAAEAKKLFPKNETAGQAVFDYRVLEKQQKLQHAEMADFLRARAKVLKREAAELEKKASEIDPA